jgi:HNH endonuclease
MSREEVVTIIRGLAEKLGHAPSLEELETMTKLRRGSIRRCFGTYMWALRECGLAPRNRPQTIPTDRLFAEWTAAVRKLKKVPSMKEFEEVSEITVGPYQREFRSWTRVPEALAEYASKHQLMEEWQDVLEVIRGQREFGLAATSTRWPAPETRPSPMRDDRPVYGSVLSPAPMLNAPTNENGVLFLFGAVAMKLGFMVTLIQTGFPDCEALREVAPGRTQRLKIEFEHESRNFLRHAHDLEGCDMIVCWIHNWPECPLEVVELRGVVGML